MKSYISMYVLENTWLTRDARYGLDFGWGNGYVRLPSNHPWFDKDYDDIKVSVNGGLTFGKHIYSGMYAIGFDTAHYMDTLAKWPKEAVVAETRRLKQQAVLAYFKS